MSLLTFILLLALEGLVVGAFARLALPGRDPMSILQTIAIGMVGTFAAGLVVYYATGRSAPPSFLVALFFAVLLVYLVRRSRGGGLMDPGRHPRRR